MNRIIEYLMDRYDPLSIIVYGSYADGSNNESSDFDALVIAKEHDYCHDISFVGGIQLDAFVYPRKHFEGEIDWDPFLQIFDGQILLDTDGIGGTVKQRVQDHMNRIPGRTAAQVSSDIAWCRKMLLRSRRNDPEGMYRWHWVLTDSLRIFCDAKDHLYFGPKKSLKWMQTEYPKAYEIYSTALSRMEYDTLAKWIDFLEGLV